MKLEKCVDNVSTFVDLKRIASEYVIDYRSLSFEDLQQAMIKTAPQYYNTDNIKNTLTYFTLHPDRNTRIIFDILITQVLLNCDDFTSEFHDTEEAVIEYEQQIVDSANEYNVEKSSESETFYKFVLEEAWAYNDDISEDEQNLINKIRKRFGISKYTNDIIEAKIGKYPTADNILHTKKEISNVRRQLQSKGLLFSIRNSNGVDYDIIPEETAKAIREFYNIDIKPYGFEKLLSAKYVRSKSYLISMLKKSDIEISVNSSLAQINSVIMEKLNAHIVLGGYSPNDGLDKKSLSDWCNQLGEATSGAKPDLIDRIIEYYDNLRQVTVDDKADERELYYNFFEDLAARNLKELRQQNVINKDLECEHKFELATNYLFEKKLKAKPLIMSGTEHPDGMLSYNNKLILWDNKSKETSVNLSDHIKQFDRYIKSSQKAVAVFLVIAPSFTDNSITECAKYSTLSDTLILLITAKELKELAERWSGKHDEPFPLGYFKQNGRFNINAINF